MPRISIGRRITVQGQPHAKMQDSIEKIKKKRELRACEVVEHLPSNPKAPSSNPSTI
jgi:hypothetical protein